MKRFISYLLLCCSIFLAVFVSFDKVFFNVNAGADFDSGREFIYQVTLKNDNDTFINGDNYLKEPKELKIDKVIDEMKKRLDAADVTNAIVEKIESTNTAEDETVYSIRVAYKAQYEQLYSAIDEFLTFDTNLSISIIKPESKDFSQYDDGDYDKQQLFKLGEVEIDNSEALPVIKLPLADPKKFNDEIFETVVGEQDKKEEAYNPIFKADEAPADPNAPAGEGEEEQPKDEDFIYVVNNWKEKYDLKEALTEEDYYTDAKKSIVYRFNVNTPESMFYKYDSESKENPALVLDYTQFAPDLSAITDRAVVQRIIHTFANIECAKLNSTPYKLDVVKINENYIAGSNQLDPFVEPIRQYGKLTVSSLLIATIVSFVLVALFMALNYGINAITGLSLGSATVLLSVGMLSLFGVEFNIGTIIALIIVAIASIFSSCIYFKAIRESCYEGKTLKKASAEASKKTFLYHVDISVVLVILGVVGYVMSNSIIMSLGAILICGGVFNFLITSIALRSITWLLTNSSFIENHINLLKIEKRLIPDLLNDEKPVYFDSFKEIKSNKTRNLIVAAVTGTLLLGSIIAIPTVNAVKGDLYGQQPETQLNSRVYIEYTTGENEDSIKGFATPEEFKTKYLDKIYTINEDKVSEKHMDYDTVTTMYHKDIVDLGTGRNSLLTFTYVINLREAVKADSEVQYAYIPDGSKDIKTKGTLVDVIEAAIKNDTKSTELGVYLMDVTNTSDDTLNYNILIFTLISISIITVYVLLRFGLGKALIALITVGGISTISVGVFSILQVGLTSVNTLAIIILTVVGYAILLHYFGREREMLKTNRNKIRDLESREEYVRLSNNLSFSTTLTALAIGFLVIISFLLSKAFAQGIVLISALGILFLILVAQALLLPMDNINKLCWRKTKELINYDNIGKKKGNKKKTTQGDGPQEAIIPGIND